MIRKERTVPAAIPRNVCRALVWATLAARAEAVPSWGQWGAGPEHRGASDVVGQPLSFILADVVSDPFAAAESADAGGDLHVHYAAALCEGPDVYVEVKTGFYVPCDPTGSSGLFPCGPAARNSQISGVQKLTWRSGALLPVWSFPSDWKPPPAGGSMGSWEPVFHPVLAGDFVYVPGFGGTVFKLSKDSGSLVARIDPFGALRTTFVAGGLAADAAGNVYYDAADLDPLTPWTADARGAWLVTIAPDGGVRKATFGSLLPDAPTRFSPCEGTFVGQDLPWPPSAAAVPPVSPCGSQRPGWNAVPAIAPDGTIYTVSRAHFNGRYSYLLAIHPDLTPAWSASLRGRLNDGCGVLLPPSGSPGGCRAGSVRGVDPGTNGLPAGQVHDASSASPVILPDGGVLYGSFTDYNYERGHLFQFSAAGEFLGAYDFGWDLTPAVFAHGSSYSILVKDNHYEVGSYCGDRDACPAERGKYDLVSLAPNLRVEWSLTNRNTLSCERSDSGGVACVSDHPDGFEWCVNQPAVDAQGVLYANSEDGTLYAIGPDGAPRGKIFLDRALGAAYTPVSIGPSGILYTQNEGHVFAIGNPARIPALGDSRQRPTRRLAPR